MAERSIADLVERSMVDLVLGPWRTSGGKRETTTRGTSSAYVSNARPTKINNGGNFMINLEMELDVALARIVDLEDEREGLIREADELRDALKAMNNVHPMIRAELMSLIRRNQELEAQLASRPAS